MRDTYRQQPTDEGRAQRTLDELKRQYPGKSVHVEISMWHHAFDPERPTARWTVSVFPVDHHHCEQGYGNTPTEALIGLRAAMDRYCRAERGQL